MSTDKNNPQRELDLGDNARAIPSADYICALDEIVQGLLRDDREGDQFDDFKRGVADGHAYGIRDEHSDLAFPARGSHSYGHGVEVGRCIAFLRIGGTRWGRRRP